VAAVADTLMLTTKCSAGCLHCPFSQTDLPAMHLSPAQLRGYFRASQANLIVISGGETFEHPEIGDLLSELALQAKPFRIATGGHINLLPWAGLIAKLACGNCGFQGVSLGTDALTPRCPNPNLARVWRQNLAWLNEAELPYSITITLGEDLTMGARSAIDQEMMRARPEFLYIRQPGNLEGDVAKWAENLPKYIGTEAIFDHFDE